MRDEAHKLRDLAGVDTRPTNAEAADDHGLVALALLFDTREIRAECRIVGETQQDNLAALQCFSLHGGLIRLGDDRRSSRRRTGVLLPVGNDERHGVRDIGGAHELLAVSDRSLDGIRHGVVEGSTAATVKLPLVVARVDGTKELEAVDFLHAMIELQDAEHEAVSSRIFLTRTHDFGDELFDRSAVR